MNHVALTEFDAASGMPGMPLAIYEDPLDADDCTDVHVTTSRRGLTRLALVAAETGARFQREELEHDPMAWLLAPRSLFDGASAVEACLELDNCLRALLLHGLSIGLDARPGAIDALRGEEGDDDRAAPDRTDDYRAGGVGGGRRRQRQRLYTATVTVARGGELLQAFHASVAPSAAVVRERIRARLGSAAAAQAEIRVGFEPASADTRGLVPPAVLETLAGAGAPTRWAAMTGLDVTVEQRLPS